MSKLDPNIYLKAAMKLERNSRDVELRLPEDTLNLFACNALKFILKEPYLERITEPHLDLFQDVFDPRTGSGVWFGNFTPENQLARQLALLFMAEIAKEQR